MSRKMPKKLDPLQKRIPINPKYKNVKPTIDTGASLSKQLQKIEELKQNYKFSKDEIFKRMKITTFVQLVVQVYHLENDDLETPDTPTSEGSRNEIETEKKDGAAHWPANIGIGDGNNNVPETDRSTFLGVAQGIGEMDLKERQQLPHHQQQQQQNANNTKSQLIINGQGSYSNSGDLCPYLLLDVRDRDDYDRCRIIPAYNFPKSMLSRSVNYESKEMLAFKNKEGKVIVVYDDDETIAPIVTTSLLQRGYDNIFMLSGGLKLAYKMFPEGLITGSMPPSLLSSREGDAVRKLDHLSRQPTTNLQTPIQSLKHSLEREDVEKLEINLSNMMRTSVASGSSLSSRISKSSVSLRNIRVSSSCSSSRSGSISLGRPAFKP